MSFRIHLLVPLLFVLSIASCFPGDYYQGKWVTLGIAMAASAALLVHKRLGAAAASLFFFLACSGLWTTIYANRYSTVNPYDLMAIKLFSMESMMKLGIILLPFVSMEYTTVSRRGLIDMGKALCFVFFAVSAGQVFYEWVRYGCDGINLCGGALRNPSMNAAMMAVLLPLMPFPLVSTMLAIAVSLIGKSSIGAGMVGLFMLMHYRGKLKWVIPIIPIILLANYFAHGHKGINSSGRFPMWIFFMRVWAVNWHNWIFGTGFGTFGVFSTNLQSFYGKAANDWWMWMHNDWLQMLFECGVVGLSLMVWLYGACISGLNRARMYPELQSLLLFGVMMGCNFPLHLAPCCLYATWIVFISLMKTQTSATHLSDQHGVNDTVMGNILGH